MTSRSPHKPQRVKPFFILHELLFQFYIKRNPAFLYKPCSATPIGQGGICVAGWNTMTILYRMTFSETSRCDILKERVLRHSVAMTLSPLSLNVRQITCHGRNAAECFFAQLAQHQESTSSPGPPDPPDPPDPCEGENGAIAVVVVKPHLSMFSHQSLVPGSNPKVHCLLAS